MIAKTKRKVNMYRTSIRTLLISAACMLAITVAVTGAFGQNAPAGGRAEAAFKDIKVLQGTPADQLIPTMQFFEGSLGVTCNYCHLPSEPSKNCIVGINWSAGVPCSTLMSLKAASARPAAGAVWPNAPVTATLIANMQPAEMSSVLMLALYIFPFLFVLAIISWFDQGPPPPPKCPNRV